LLSKGLDPNLRDAEGRDLVTAALSLDGLYRLAVSGGPHSFSNGDAEPGPYSVIEELIAGLHLASEDSHPELIDLALETGLPWPLIQKLVDLGYQPSPHALARFFSERSERRAGDLVGLKKFFEFFPNFEVNYASLMAAAKLRPDHSKSRNWVLVRLEIFKILIEHGGMNCPELSTDSSLMAEINRHPSRHSALELNRLFVGLGAHYEAAATFEENPIALAARNRDWPSLDYLLTLPQSGMAQLDEMARGLEQPFDSFADYCKSLKAPAATLETIQALAPGVSASEN